MHDPRNKLGSQNTFDMDFAAVIRTESEFLQMVDNRFFVPPEIGCSLHGCSGSEQAVEKVFDKSSFASTHDLFLSFFQGVAL